MLLCFAAASRQLLAAPATALPIPRVCGTVDPGETVNEPPAVAMWRMPKNDQGLPELILSVHTSGDTFCYHYTANGVTHRVAPIIHVRPGETFAVRVVNDISSQSPGETVAARAIPPCMPMAMHPGPVQHYVGYLNHIIDERTMRMRPIDTNIHFHGFEGPTADDNVFLSTLSTPMHACEYQIDIPKTQPPGTYFYHPHAHGMSFDEVAGGLAGVWIVDPPKPEVPAADDHLLIVRYQIPLADDLTELNETPFLLAAAAYNAALRPVPLYPYDPFDPPDWPIDYPLSAGGASFASHGCWGVRTDARLAINDSRTPATLDVPGGRMQVIRVLSAIADSAKQISLRDARGRRVPMRIAEIDGVPVGGSEVAPLSRYIPVDRFELAPASRIDLLVEVPVGGRVVLHADRHCEGYEGARQVSEDLVDIRGVAPVPASTDSVDTQPLTPAASAQTPAGRLLAYARAHPTLVHRRAIAFTQYVFPARTKRKYKFVFYITDTTNPNFHEHSYDPQYRMGDNFPIHPDIIVKQGTVEEWYLINATTDRHSFHIHQMSFVAERGAGGFPT